MASTYTPLGIELQATGENAGTWGNKTNVNLQVVEQIAGGFTQQALTSGGTVALTSSDSGTGDVLAHRVIEFTGSLSDNAVVTIPTDVQNFYLLRNSSSGSYTVQFKYTSGSGSSVTFSATDKGDKLVVAKGDDGTNPNIVEISLATAGTVTETGTQTLTNKTLTSPKIGTSILDTNGAELFKLTATSSAVNEITYNNAATGNKPTFTASGDDSNIGISIQPKGTGTVTIDALTFPAADGTSGQILQTNGSGVLSFTTASSGISMGKAIAAAIVFG